MLTKTTCRAKVLILKTAGCLFCCTLAACSAYTGSADIGGKNGLRPNSEGCACSYRSYSGSAVITRILQTATSEGQAKVRGGPGYPGFEVWFRFVPGAGQSIQGGPLPDREHLFTLRNGWYVGSGYLDKYGLTPGKSIPCVLKLIERGTCSPVYFDFSTVPTEDYFEGRSR